MQSDRRYPHCFPIDGPLPNLSPDHAWSARLVGKAVASRTQTNCFYVSTTGKLMWVYGAEPAGGPLIVPFRTRDGILSYDNGAIDEMVRYINLGKMPRAQKDRIAASTAASEEHDRQERNGQWLADRRPDMERKAEHLDRKRRGTATAVVALSKGAS